MQKDTMSKGHLLTKSKFIRGLQCERAMWLDVYNPRMARYSRETLDKFRAGRNFEHSFKSTYPEGIDISKRLGRRVGQYPVLTAQLLREAGEVTLFEAGFLYDDVLVLADVVCKHSDGSIDIYEVKGGRAISETFRNDVAIQTYVIAHALQQIGGGDLFNPGLCLRHFDLLYDGGEEGFQKEDQLEASLQRQEEIAGKVSHFKSVLGGGEPAIVQSDHCMQPYECPYRQYCMLQAISGK